MYPAELVAKGRKFAYAKKVFEHSKPRSYLLHALPYTIFIYSYYMHYDYIA